MPNPVLLVCRGRLHMYQALCSLSRALTQPKPSLVFPFTILELMVRRDLWYLILPCLLQMWMSASRLTADVRSCA